MNIHREFPILVIAAPSFNSQPFYVTIGAKDKNRSNVAVRATLIDQKSSFLPGDNFLLNIEVLNSNHNTIEKFSINLIQHRNIAMGKHCKQTIPLLDLLHLRGFFDENYRETVQLTIPDDNRIIPSFYYMSPELSNEKIVVEYMLKLKVQISGFFNDIILNIPIRVHSMEMYMVSSNEQEAPPPSYEVAIATL
jgi:hypothetical protein